MIVACMRAFSLNYWCNTVSIFVYVYIIFYIMLMKLIISQLQFFVFLTFYKFFNIATLSHSLQRNQDGRTHLSILFA